MRPHRSTPRSNSVRYRLKIKGDARLVAHNPDLAKLKSLLEDTESAGP